MEAKFIDCEQGSDEWLAARLGKPTASNFGKIVSSTGKPSTQAAGYMHTLLAEMITGTTDSIQQTEWMQRGIEMEAEAAAWYAFEKGVEPETVGFVDAGRYGCSPDRLIGDDALLEIKCPKPSTHVGYLLAGKLPAAYVPQVQGQLWVCGRQRSDFLSYCPGMPEFLITVERDNDFIKCLEKEMQAFIANLDKKRERLIKLGYLTIGTGI